MQHPNQSSVFVFSSWPAYSRQAYSRVREWETTEVEAIQSCLSLPDTAESVLTTYKLKQSTNRDDLDRAMTPCPIHALGHNSDIYLWPGTLLAEDTRKRVRTCTYARTVTLSKSSVNQWCSSFSVCTIWIMHYVYSQFTFTSSQGQM